MLLEGQELDIVLKCDMVKKLLGSSKAEQKSELFLVLSFEDFIGLLFFYICSIIKIQVVEV